jgi:TonB-linked SusC/RagA family outer membrane protein
MKYSFITKKRKALNLKGSLLLLLLLFVSYGVRAQNQKVTLPQKQTTIISAFEEIERQTNLKVAYNEATINVNRSITVDIENKTLTEALTAILQGTNTTFRIQGRQIIIVPLPPAVPTKKYVGTVIDSKGVPVTGASLFIKGSQTGVFTDIDGKFTIEAPSNSTLLVSFVGYEAQEITLGDNLNLQITMQEDQKLLDEVVVIGYGTQSQKTLTGSVSKINMANIESGTKSSISQALAGKAAGLRAFQQSAQPGGGVNLKIRGEGSLNAGNDPLIVVDGFPINAAGSLDFSIKQKQGSVDNMLDFLNPEDVESITVLKDAASTAIYGSRAGHGVILITTKKGKEQKAQVSYSGNVSVQQIRNNYQMLDTRSFMEMRNRQLYEEYLKVYGLGIYKDYIINPAEAPPFNPKYTNDQIYRVQGTDWMKQISRTGLMHQHNISINGGKESTQYLLSANYMKQDGVIRNNSAERFSFRFNINQELSKYLSIGTNITYSLNKYDNIPLGSETQENSGIITAAIQANPANPVYDENGNYYIDPERSFVPNVVSLLDIVDVSKRDRILGTAHALLKPVNYLELKLVLGADKKFQKRSSYMPKTTLYGQVDQGNANILQSESADYLMEITASYKKTLGDHKLQGIAGYSFQKFTGEGVSAGNKDFITDGFLYHNIGAGGYEKPIVGSSYGNHALGSCFARIHYNYLERYLLEGTIRADGDSNFDPDYRWGYFPSVAFAWRIIEEPFMQNTNKYLSNLKLRMSYGQTGNSNVGYRIKDFYSVGNSVIFGESQKEQMGVYASTLGNPKLTWETTTEFNIGLDVGFLKDRIRLTAEYFNRRISDLLNTKQLLSYNEITSIAANIGETKSTGYELTLNTSNIYSKDMEWNTTLTLAHYEDRWSKRDPDWKPQPYEKADDPLRAQYYYHALGIMRPGEKAPAAQTDLLPGMIILQDVDGNGVLGQEDYLYLGNGAPKLTFGFNNAFRYKRFDMNIYFYGEFGRKRTESYLESWIRTGGENVSIHSYKSFNHNNTTSNHPTYLFGGQNFGDYYAKSIYYIRCGNINLGYTVPIKSTIAKKVRLYADVSNPFVITNWTGVDPETDNGSFAYPNIISCSLGLNITF